MGTARPVMGPDMFSLKLGTLLLDQQKYMSCRQMYRSLHVSTVGPFSNDKDTLYVQVLFC
jgi:hypothetical protein